MECSSNPHSHISHGISAQSDTGSRIMMPAPDIHAEIIETVILGTTFLLRLISRIAALSPDSAVYSRPFFKLFPISHVAGTAPSTTPS
jgi:hypothetical protein